MIQFLSLGVRIKVVRTIVGAGGFLAEGGRDAPLADGGRDASFDFNPDGGRELRRPVDEGGRDESFPVLAEAASEELFAASSEEGAVLSKMASGPGAFVLSATGAIMSFVSWDGFDWTSSCFPSIPVGVVAPCTPFSEEGAMFSDIGSGLELSFVSWDGFDWTSSCLPSIPVGVVAPGNVKSTKSGYICDWGGF